MPLFTSRKKSVTFRLSAEEFEALRSYCITHKIRSISELARASILQHVYGDRARRNLVSKDLLSLGSALEDIDTAIRDLSTKIAKVLGPPKE
jgi:hypothetical protein